MPGKNYQQKRTWHERGSAEDSENKKPKGTVTSTSNSDSDTNIEDSCCSSDNECVFDIAPEQPSVTCENLSENKMATNVAGGSLVDQLIQALQNPKVLNTICGNITEPLRGHPTIFFLSRSHEIYLVPTK